MHVSFLLSSLYVVFAFYFTKESEYDYWRKYYPSSRKRFLALIARYTLPAAAGFMVWMTAFRMELNVGFALLVFLVSHAMIDVLAGEIVVRLPEWRRRTKVDLIRRFLVKLETLFDLLSPYAVVLMHIFISFVVFQDLEDAIAGRWAPYMALSIESVAAAFAFVSVGTPVNYMLKNALRSFRPIEEAKTVESKPPSPSTHAVEPTRADSIDIPVVSQSVPNEQNHQKPIKNAGSFIGLMERWLMFACIFFGQYAAAGLVLTAKSIARYDRISKSSEFAEYYLLGTLFSVLATIAAYALSTLFR